MNFLAISHILLSLRICRIRIRSGGSWLVEDIRKWRGLERIIKNIEQCQQKPRLLQIY